MGGAAFASLHRAPTSSLAADWTRAGKASDLSPSTTHKTHDEQSVKETSSEMETRKRNKRKISFSSSESSEPAEVSKPMPRITIKQIKPESVESESEGSSALSDAVSVEDVGVGVGDEEEEEEDGQEEEDEDPSDEDEEAIIESIMQPQIDTSKKTARQKAKETGAVDHLEFLPIDRMSKVKPALTAEELALKKSENARKRKNQTEKKLDEEKQETINRLLNKQAGKRKGAVKQLSAADTAGLEELEEAAQAQVRKTRPVPLGMIRYVSNKEGSFVSVPQELIGHVVTRRVFG